jgi:integrase
LVIHSRTYGRYYFQDKSGIFYFRVVTPLFLRDRFPNLQKELRRSLHTASIRKAKQQATRLYLTVTNEFVIALENLSTIEDALKYIPAAISIKTKLPNPLVDELRNTYEEIISANKELVELRYLEDIADAERKILRSIGDGIDIICQMHFIDDIDEKVAPSVINMMVEKTNKLINRLKREASQTPYHKGFNPETDPQILPVAQDDLFSDVCEKFIEERITGNNWEAKTRGAYESTFEIFKQIIGDIPVATIRAKECREFKSKVQLIPKNHSKMAAYRNKTIQQLLQKKVPVQKRISTESANKHIGRISSLLNWCTQQDYADKNPIAGMQIRTNKAKIDTRLPFDIDDLNILFDDPIYTEGKYKHSYHFWLPLIALYTGARIQEICQLQVSDIYELDGILVFDINDESPSKKLKNTNSKRIIPAHEDLKTLGFNLLLDRRQRHKQKYLFPELHQNTDQRDGQSQPASKWFARYKSKHGFKLDGVKAFHSFRHTFVNELKHSNTPEHITAALAGHTHESITYGTYGGKNAVELLNKHLQKIEYEGFNKQQIIWHPK